MEAIPDPAGWLAARARMVDTQIAARGVDSVRVLHAMREVPRERFVPSQHRGDACADIPLQIGYGQTISQPYIVALMSELAEIEPGDRVLEIGTGSGYQTAVLVALGAYVYTIEIVPELAKRTAVLFAQLGLGRIEQRTGDGNAGWPEAAPFDAILVAAAPPSIPRALLEQLEIGGRLVIPVGTEEQELQQIIRTAEGFETHSILPVRFVPMTGKAERA